MIRTCPALERVRTGEHAARAGARGRRPDGDRDRPPQHRPRADEQALAAGAGPARRHAPHTGHQCGEAVSGALPDSVETGPGLVLGEDVQIGEGVRFGAYVVVHDGTVIGAGCSIEDHAVLGKRPRLARHSGARRARGGGAGAGRACERGRGRGGVRRRQHRARSDPGRSDLRARAHARWARASVIGRGSVVDNDVQVGARVRVQTNVYLTAFTLVEDDVFVGPGATPPTTTPWPATAETPIRGATLRRACRVGGGARADAGRGDRRGGVCGGRRGGHARRACRVRW